MTPLISVRDLVIEFDTPLGRKRVVNQVSFEVNPGEILGILGESGSGKTMSTQAVLGLIDGEPGIVSGEILIDNHETRISTLADLKQYTKVKGSTKDHELIVKNNRGWKRHIHQVMKPLWGNIVTAIFQNPRRSLDPLMTIGQQITEALPVHSIAPSEKKMKAIEWLTRVQMTQPDRVYDSYPHELSGGMCQRAMIAVALACEPKILIADEPTTGLDATVRAQVVTLLKDLIRQQKCSMLYISHDIREMLYLTDKVIVMRHGEIVERVMTDVMKSGQGTRHPYTQTLLSTSGLIEGALS